MADSGGSGTLLHEKLAIAERGSSKWKAFLLRGGPKRGVRRDSILEEKRAIASRSDRLRDSTKQRRLADLVAQSDNGSPSILEEKQAIARRSISVRGVASRQKENPNHEAGAASVSISVLDEKRAIATRSDRKRDARKRRENQGRAGSATDTHGNVLDDKLAIVAKSARIRKGSTERAGDDILEENHAIAERGDGGKEAPISGIEHINDEESTNPTLNPSEAGVNYDVEGPHNDPQERLMGELKPGAYSVSASSTRALHGPGMLTPTKRAQSSGRNQRTSSHGGISNDTGELTSEDKTWCESVNKTALYVVGGCLLIVVILAVSIPLSLVSPPSPRSQVYDGMRSVIVNVTGEQALANPNSPQSQAFNWIVYEDPSALAVDDPTLIQRYTLMTMYYANDGKEWNYSDGIHWGSGVSECSWYSVTCSVVNNVTDLNLAGVGMTGTLVSEMPHLTQLSTLDLSMNLLNESVFPTVLTQIVALEELTLNNVGNPQMGGALPGAIGNLTNLQRLIITNNAFTGTLPATMKGLTNLNVASISSNHFSGRLFDIVLTWTQLLHFETYTNAFGGSIPTEISRLSYLDYVALNGNNFSGSLPSELGMLTKMTSFHWENVLNGNGSIPNELRSWSNLRECLLFSISLPMFNIVSNTLAHATQRTL